MSDTHHDILAVLHEAFNENVFAEFIPELMGTSYLGPDLEALTLAETSGSAEEAAPLDGMGGKSPPKTTIIVLSLGCIVMLLKALSCVAFPTTRRVAFGKVISYYRQKRHRALPTCSGLSVEEELNGPLVQYSDGSKVG